MQPLHKSSAGKDQASQKSIGYLTMGPTASPSAGKIGSSEKVLVT